MSGPILKWFWAYLKINLGLFEHKIRPRKTVFDLLSKFEEKTSYFVQNTKQ